MRPSSHLHRRVLRVAVVLQLASLACSAELPKGTLAVVAAKSLQDLDATATRLLEPWQLKFNGLAPIFQRLAPGVEVPPGPVAVGAVKHGNRLGLYLLLTTDKAGDLEAAVQARPAPQSKVAVVGGYSVVIAQVNGGAYLSFGVGVLPAEGNDPLSAIAELLGDADAAVSVTDQGFNHVASWSAQLGLARGRVDWRRIRSLNHALRLLNRLGPYAPLFRGLAVESVGARLRLTADPASNALTAELDFQCAKEAAPPAAEAGATAPTTEALVGDRQPIVTFRSDRPLPPPLVRLALAWSQSQPNDIDADRFEPRTFAAYAESATQLLSAITQLRLAWLIPGEDEPLATNAIEYARVREDLDLLEAIGESTTAMNETVRRSRARTPLLTEIEEIDTPAGPGMRMTTDVLGALGGGDIPAVRSVIERYYGPNGQHVVDVTPLGGDQWLRSSTQDEAIQTRLLADQAPAAEQQAELRLWLDRWLAWRQSIDNVGKENDAGRKVRPPMAAAPPLRMRLNAEDDRLRCEVELPTETYEALAAYWIAEMVEHP